MKRHILIVGAFSALATFTALADPDTHQLVGRSVTYKNAAGELVTDQYQMEEKPKTTVIPDYTREEHFTTYDIDGQPCQHIVSHHVYHLKGDPTQHEWTEQGEVRAAVSDINPHQESIRPSRKRQHEHGQVLDQSYEVLTDW